MSVRKSAPKSMTGAQTPHPLSFSMQVDEAAGIGCSPPEHNPGLVELRIRARSVETWVPDDAVTRCFGCNTHFRFYLRRHHCRACGRIFCHACSDHWEQLPRDLERYPAAHGTAEWLQAWTSWCAARNLKRERTCAKCARKLQRTRDVWDTVRVFDLLELNIVDLARAGLVCRSWCRASLSSLSAFREIQYRLPMQELSARERMQLRLNAALLQGHSRWMVQLLRAQGNADAIECAQLRHRALSCWRTMCGRYCRPKLCASEALQLILDPRSSTALVEFAAARAFKSPSGEFDILMPLLLLFCHNGPQLFRAMCKRALDEQNPLWLARCHACAAQHRAALEPLLRAAVESGDWPGAVLWEELARGTALLRGGAQGQLRVDAPARVAFSEHAIVGVDSARIRIKRSATRPTVVPFALDSGAELSLLYKSEDVRGDLIVMQTIRYMDRILREEESLQLGIVTYGVQPLSADRGILEIVRGARTLYEIKHVLNSTLLNYLLERNPRAPVERVRGNFVRSTAAYCVITFLLGVGDRHLENIMLTEDGRLFHIDYGFLLGADPKPLAAPVMRISQDMVDAIGGFGTPSYDEFQRLCTQIYNCLRRHTQEIATMLWPLAQLGLCSEEQLRREIMMRFVPGENHLEARLQLTTRLEDSRSSTYGPTIDFFHHTSLTASRTLKEWLKMLWQHEEDT